LTLEKLAFARPNIFELTVKLLDTGQMKLNTIAVTTLRENVYYASLSVQASGHTHEIDARPSDAITLALQMSEPIFVSEETWQQAAGAGYLLTAGHESRLEQLHAKGVAAGIVEADATEMEFRSYRSLPRAEVPGLVTREKSPG
jgi:Domain of unknown function (DUF151)